MISEGLSSVDRARSSAASRTVEVVGGLTEVFDGPAVGGEAAGDVVRVGELGRAVDGDVVVVVDVDEVPESEMAGE